MKTCSSCGETKPLSEFSKHRCKRDGLDYSCRNCNAKRWAVYSKRNRPMLRARGRARYWANREVELQSKKQDRDEHLLEYREREKEAKRRRRREKPEQVRAYRLAHYQRNKVRERLRCRLAKAFRQFSQSGKLRSSDEYGIDYEAIIAYLGRPPDESGNWQIDHIRPLASFDFTELAQIREAFAPENHQWLSAFDNRSKGARYESSGT